MSDRELLDRQAARESNARTYPRGLPLAIGRALGAEVWSTDGKRYLDFFSGAGVLALGHNHPRVIEAVQAQLETLVHGLDFPTPARDRFVTALLGLIPEAWRDGMRVHVCAPTGADAVEAAIKLCKRATGRSGVLSFRGAYHGMTAGALALSSDVERKRRMPALMPEVSFAPYAYCYRCPLELKSPACGTACAAFVETMFEDTHSGVPLPAAAIMEFVQGEGGTVIPPGDFVRRVRAATARAGVPLIADEIQCGLGRTGRWWGFEHFDVRPDVILTSKALGGIGLPIAAMLYRAELDVWEPGEHIGTFRGHQLAMAAGTAALEVMMQEGVLDNARRRGEELLGALRAMPFEFFGEARGLGLMLGVDLADPGTRVPLPALAQRLRTECFARGLLVELGGRAGATLRLLPPLIISEVQAREAVDVIAAAASATARAFERSGGVDMARWDGA